MSGTFGGSMGGGEFEEAPQKAHCLFFLREETKDSECKTLNVRPGRTGLVLSDESSDQVLVLQRFTVQDGVAKTRNFRIELWGVYEDVEVQRPVEVKNLEGWEVIVGEEEDGETEIRLEFRGEQEPVVDDRGFVTDPNHPAIVPLCFVHGGQEYHRILRVILCNDEMWQKVRRNPSFIAEVKETCLSPECSSAL